MATLRNGWPADWHAGSLGWLANWLRMIEIFLADAWLAGWLAGRPLPLAGSLAPWGHSFRTGHPSYQSGHLASFAFANHPKRGHPLPPTSRNGNY